VRREEGKKGSRKGEKGMDRVGIEPTTYRAADCLLS
jgi:hypothetical protein